MDLKYLNTFRAIVEEGSFSRAAEKLGYTQSTITFQVGQLEGELSAKLFEKLGRRMVLTKAGEGLLPYVEEVLDSVDRLRCFQTDLAQCRGDLRVGAGETLLSYRLPPVLKEFHRQAPQARLFIRSMNCYDIRDALLDGALDVGIFYGDVGGLEGNLTTYPLGECPVALVASPQVKGAWPDYVTVGQEIPYPLLINEPNCIFRQMFEAYIKERSIRLDHTIELESIHTIKRLVEHDVGVTSLPRFAVEEELRDGRLEELTLGIEAPRLHPVCGHHKNKWLSPLVELFLDLVRKGPLV